MSSNPNHWPYRGPIQLVTSLSYDNFTGKYTSKININGTPEDWEFFKQNYPTAEHIPSVYTLRHIVKYLNGEEDQFLFAQDMKYDP